MKFSDNVVKHFTDYTSTLQNIWVADMLELLTQPTGCTQLVLLCGDAGAGKTTVIHKLQSLLEPMGLCRVTAATLNAAGLHQAPTIHSYMAINTLELLDSTLSEADWIAEYRRVHATALSEHRQMINGYQLEPDHMCRTLKMRCLKCRIYMSRRGGGRAGWPAGVYNCPMIIIDEYGMLTAQTLRRILASAMLWAPPDDHHLIVLAGSVTQLAPCVVDKSKPKIAPIFKQQVQQATDENSEIGGMWLFKNWDDLLVASYNLPFSMRSINDPLFSECMNIMQYNVCTPTCLKILQSRTFADKPISTYPVEWPIIVHKDTDVEQINESVQRCIETPLIEFKPRITGSLVKRNKFIYQMSKRFRHVNFYKSLMLQEGSLVLVLKLKSAMCVEVKDEPSSSSSPSPLIPLSENFEGNMGVCVSILERETGDDRTVIVRSFESGKRYQILLYNYSSEGKNCTFMPLKLCHAMNTYAVQGLTFKFPIVYNPPKWYNQSPMKPSCYVVCTRVTHRKSLFLTNCFFAIPPGRKSYFDNKCITHKIKYELGYSE